MRQDREVDRVPLDANVVGNIGLLPDAKHVAHHAVVRLWLDLGLREERRIDVLLVGLVYVCDVVSISEETDISLRVWRKNVHSQSCP